MILPSDAGGAVTQTAGYIEQDANVVAGWLAPALGAGFGAHALAWDSLASAVAALSGSGPLSRRAVIPIGSWTLLLTDGPGGTDVGLLPSHAAREWGCNAIRATCVEAGEHVYPGRILEIFGPDGAPPLMSRRSIAAMNDGGRWVFETSGEPFEFEHPEYYTHRRKSQRFTSALLYEYLRDLRVPIDTEPDWGRAVSIEHNS